MNHGDAAPLTAAGIVPASFLSRGARLHKKKKNYTSFLRRLLMPRRGRSGSLSPTRPPPYLRHRLPPRRLTIHQFLRRLRDQHHRIIRLIGEYGPLLRVRYSLSRHPEVPLESTLRDCLGLQDIVVGDLVSLDAPAFQVLFRAPEFYSTDSPALEYLSHQF